MASTRDGLAGHAKCRDSLIKISEKTIGRRAKGQALHTDELNIGAGKHIGMQPVSVVHFAMGRGGVSAAAQGPGARIVAG
jgi:hypothetical protein